MAGAAAMLADLAGDLHQARPHPLARHLQKAEMADAAKLDARPIVPQGLLEAPLDRVVVARLLHVDEIAADQPREIAKPDLPRHPVGRFAVGLPRRLLDITLARRAAGGHVDRNPHHGQAGRTPGWARG